ncbi:MAG: biotin--[acetyl-CoA-carboxylase] ligase [Crocinitomicaceae bacterium]|nr:biotin--[acetyl-CoA-carboxylase] ligase [Crocinitomicaceae bacterium]|tara:strand:- start:62583 stop:63308 length:726 start_codon:yes stop_codon:yes gene_type:complete
MEIGQKVIHLNHVDSTNNYTAKLLNEGLIDHGTVILAEEQFSGKGYRSSRWVSNPGENLTISVFLDNVNLSVKNQFVLTKIVSLILVDLLKRFKIKSKIKWPNDIYVDGEKIAGVLIENQIKLSVIKSSIIGIGLNVNQIHFEDFIATSVKKKTGKFESINDFLYVFIHSFNKVWNQYFHQVNLLDREYFNYLYLKDVKSNYKDNSGVFSGIIRGVKSSGKLLIEKDNTRIEYGMKEIEFI